MRHLESEKTIRFASSITVTNPCTGEQLTATGTTKLTIEVSRNGRVEVSEEFQGRAGVGRDAYRVELEGEGRFPQTAASYHLTNLRGKWEGQGRNKDFVTRGQSDVFATPDGRTPTSDVTTFDSTKCEGKPAAPGGVFGLTVTVTSSIPYPCGQVVGPAPTFNLSPVPTPGSPLVGVSVVVVNINDMGSARLAVTNAAGVATFSSLPAGTYRITTADNSKDYTTVNIAGFSGAEAPAGYMIDSRLVNVTGPLNVPISLFCKTAGLVVPDGEPIDFPTPVPATGTMSIVFGYLVDWFTGLPISGATILLNANVGTEAAPVAGTQLAALVTDPNGRFETLEIPSGPVVVRVAPGVAVNCMVSGINTCSDAMQLLPGRMHDPAFIAATGGGTSGSVSIYDATCVAGNACVFNVERTGGTGTANVSYQTADGTAGGFAACTSGHDFDYVVSGGTITVAANGTATISIPTCADIGPEASETFNVVLSNPTGGATIGDGIGVGTIFALTPTPTLPTGGAAITAVQPPVSGPAGGQAITISGTNFMPDTCTAAQMTGVTVVVVDPNGAPAMATSVVVVNDTTITAVTPPHSAGQFPIRIAQGVPAGGCTGTARIIDSPPSVFLVYLLFDPITPTGTLTPTPTAISTATLTATATATPTGP
jgi:hypothetical protein